MLRSGRGTILKKGGWLIMKHKFLVGAAMLCAPCAAHAQQVAANESDGGEQIVVTGQRAQQERSIEAKRDALGVVDVAASNEMGQLPDRNVAEVIEHLPGVGVTYDQGEGRYVAIRGVPSNLNGYTLNGLEIGNPDGTTRSLPLDIVSGQLLNRVEVNKVKTAAMDGQGIGGSINLVTQTAFDFKNSFSVAGSVKAGYQELNKKVPVQGELSVAKRFGPDEQFGIVLGASYSNRDFASDGFYPDDWRPYPGAAKGGLPTDIKYTEYSLDRRRLGASGSFDWHPTDHQTFYVRGVYSKFIENEIRGRYRLDFATVAITDAAKARAACGLAPGFVLNPDGTSGTVTPTNAVAAGACGPGSAAIAAIAPERREDLRLDYKAKSVLTGMVGGSTEIGALKFDYVVGRSHNEVLDKFPIWQFRCNPGTVNFNFSNVIFSAAPATECTGSQMQFRQYTFSHQKGVEDIWQGKLDATYDLGGEDFIKVGAKYRSSDRDFDASNDTWGRGGNAATRFSLSQFNLQGPDVVVHPDGSNPGNGYLNSPTIDPRAIQAFTDANLPGPYFVLDGPTSLVNATLSDFTLSEDVASAYAMGNFEFGAITVTPGVRWENTRLHITGYQLQANGTTVLPVTATHNYDDFLPSLIVRIRPSSKTVFRLAYSRSLGRPEYASLTPGGSISVDDGSAPGKLVAGVSLGNPNLKPYRADNFDATAEWYFARGGLFSIGAFAKIIKNPIFTESFFVNNGTFNGQQYEVVSFSQPLNADKGDIIGIEAQYQQQFTFLPGLLSGFGIKLNGTLTDSTLRLPDGRVSTFPSQSEYLYGGQLFYQKGIVEASVAYHNTGKAILSAGDLAYQDQYNNDLRRLDAKASFKLLPYARLFFEAQNLTDEPTRQYQGGDPNWTIQNERYGRTFYAGVSAKF